MGNGGAVGFVPRGTIWEREPKWEMFHVEQKSPWPNLGTVPIWDRLLRSLCWPRSYKSFPPITPFVRSLSPPGALPQNPLSLMGFLPHLPLPCRKISTANSGSPQPNSQPHPGPCLYSGNPWERSSASSIKKAELAKPPQPLTSRPAWPSKG